MKHQEENTTEELNKDRLGKIIALAKGGVGGEKANALRMVKAICKRHGLDFNDVMENITIKEFEISYRTLDERLVLIRCIFRYGMLKYEDKVWGKYPKKIGFKSTTEKYIEVLNAYSVLKALYKKERAKSEEALILAFTKKHNLYYNPTDEEWKIINKKRKKEKEKPRDKSIDLMADGMSMGMESAEIHKQLKA